MASGQSGSPKHSSGEVVEILCISKGNRGRSCDEHAICGIVVKVDLLVRIRKIQILLAGREESAMAVYWVSDGIDRCHIGFLPRHTIKHAPKYDGHLAQIIEVYSEHDKMSNSKRKKVHKNFGCCLAAMLSFGAPKVSAMGSLQHAGGDAAETVESDSEKRGSLHYQARMSAAGSLAEVPGQLKYNSSHSADASDSSDDSTPVSKKAKKTVIPSLPDM